MFGDQLAQHLAVHGRITRQERRAEAGGEFRLRLIAETSLGTRDLGSIARQEVIHRLRRCQLGDRRQNAKSVGREHHNILRLSGTTGRRRVRNRIERISRASVLGLGAVVEIDFASRRIDRDIFQDRAEAQAGVVDRGLGFTREANGLGVAAALEIEHAVRSPAVLVVAEQRAAGIGGERGLAGAGQPEEHCRVAFRPDIGGAMHRQHALFGQIEVQRGEHRLLHLAGVLAAADQHDLAREVDGDHVFRFAAMTFRVGPEARQIDDGEFRHEACQLSRFGPAQQCADEQRVPRKLGVDTHLDLEFRIGAAMEILREQRHPLGMLDEVRMQRRELFRRDRLIGAPRHRCVGERIAHRELVLRAAAGELAGLGA